MFYRPAVTIVVTDSDGEHVQTIELDELTIPDDELSPEWLAMDDTEAA